MPELPEVETVRRGLEPVITGQRLSAVEFRRDDLRWPIPTAAIEALVGRRCLEVARRSKYLLLTFDSTPRSVALVHLGMSGRLVVDPARPLPPWRKHEHWRMRFGAALVRYDDARRFGALDLVAESDLPSHPLLAKLGPEPLSDAFDGAYLWTKTRDRKAAVKVLIMDAAVVVGVGNIYASESCFRARVRPARAAGRLSRPDCDRLASAIVTTLRAAIDAGGTTLRDYVGVDEGSGWFQLELFVYGRDGEPCRVCGTTIKRTVLGQRATYWCPKCQR
ncbi:MAG: bifunctional DNA-formamidopyrimidine glycosylase/DNA-(apurinic or apyrimidinic site) lyase [Planctomycetota bacterium]